MTMYYGRLWGHEKMYTGWIKLLNDSEYESFNLTIMCSVVCLLYYRNVSDCHCVLIHFKSEALG